jgi:hypothetical protein
MKHQIQLSIHEVIAQNLLSRLSNEDLALAFQDAEKEMIGDQWTSVMEAIDGEINLRIFIGLL